MKRKTTKEIFAESFRELAQTHPVDKITIQEIADNCDYSSATFYRHFKDKYDLIAWDYVHRTTEIMNKIGKDEYEWKDTLWDAMDFYLKNKEYIYCCGMVQTVCEWLLDNIKCYPDHLADLLEQALPASLHDILYVK